MAGRSRLRWLVPVRRGSLILLVAAGVPGLLVSSAPALAQSSASYRLQETSLNNGGDPRNGAALTSAHFHIRLDALGDAALRSGLASASFHVEEGFVGRYAPPGEVAGLLLTDTPAHVTTLQWNPEPRADRYEVYRDLLSSQPGTYGVCFAGDLAVPVSTDASLPAPGTGYFYLVTARNRLREEGSKGFTSTGQVRGNPLPCP
ncbi:MAG TPA: hypothetical protein VFQ07_10660 [Candidatus Polarisedimenticolia bacterium]|nr:hypothetical protein [Candidatus Polarisedimenticolia bacterium]